MIPIWSWSDVPGLDPMTRAIATKDHAAVRRIEAVRAASELRLGDSERAPGDA